LLGVVSCNQHNEQITGTSLPETWKFKPGDDMSYSTTGLDDSGYNGITLSSGSSAPDSINIEPSPWYKERNYVIATDDDRLFWDKENLLAVRVWDRGGLGGMYAGKPEIRMVDVGDYIEMGYNNQSFSFKNGTAYNIFRIKNVSGYVDMKGIFLLSAINDMTGKEIYKLKLNIEIPAGKDFDIPVEIPEQQESTSLKYVFNPDGSSLEKVFYDVLPYILTPEISPFPRINGAKVVGVRPGKPFLFKVPVTGEKPLKLSVLNLPAGLSFDNRKGIISGKVMSKGDYDLQITAENSKGKISEVLRVIVGDQIALTPPMGWNSWNCWGLSVDQEKVFCIGKSIC